MGRCGIVQAQSRHGLQAAPLRPPGCPTALLAMAARSWLLPMLAAVAAMTMSTTSTVCGNGNMQRGYALLSQAGRRLLSRRAWQALDVCWPQSLPGLAARHPGSSVRRHRLLPLCV